MGACRFNYGIVGGLLELGAEQCVKDYHNQSANVFTFSEKQALSSPQEEMNITWHLFQTTYRKQLPAWVINNGT